MDLYYRKQIKKNNKKIPHLSNVKNQVFDSILMDDCYKTFFFFFVHMMKMIQYYVKR